MLQEESSRRDFLRSAASAAGRSLVLLSLPALLTSRERASAAQAAGDAFRVLDAEDAADLAAIAARILPTDETPGATEAGAIYFIDHVIATERPEALEPLQQGLADLRAAAFAAHQTHQFHRLDAAQQDQLLTAIETTPFFSNMRFLTIAGTFTLPEYGGNRDGVGWALIGFEQQHMWQPPFGFYDADYAREGR